ncbi:MAG: bifunctional glutamate N-acetyltransferase/amino-acid acetyltransferase ArgJ [Hydrogenoanaerobacterium sp.]
MELAFTSGGVTAPVGFTASGVHCGIRKNKDKKDLALIYSKKPCTAAAVYTQNKVKGAPITVTQKNLANGTAKAVICNSGNANTCNADGISKAEATCKALATALGIGDDEVIVASTGVIGQPLPLEPILSSIPKLVCELSPASGNAAEAIMTTDTAKKECAVSFILGGKPCHIGGMAKGSGMIHPNMATMLCFVTTDVAISAPMLHEALLACVTDTFNMVSVDGDTSTNDMVSILANGGAENALITTKGAEYESFKAALLAVCKALAKAVAKDGEGASKLLECTVTQAPCLQTARIVAKSVITSSLFKAAMFGKDANWGRILCAVGYADAEFDINKVDVALRSAAGCVDVCKNGAGVDFSEDKALKILFEDEIFIDICLYSGEFSATAWGCDLTYDYVKINGDYRT